MKRLSTHPRLFLGVNLFLAFAILLAACAPPVAQPTAVPQVIRETVVIEGTPQVIEKVVTSTPEPTAAPPPADQPLDKARLSINSRLCGVDPHGPSCLGHFIALYMMGAQLFRLKPDFSVVPYLAEGYDVSADGLIYTITLKPDLKFSDGSPLTAEDVVYGLQRSIDMKGPRVVLLGPVTSFSAKDARTVEIVLDKPFPNLLIGLADHGYAIFPKAKIEADPDFFKKVPVVGAGQYVLTEWTPGAPEWAMEENPNFFDGPSMIKRIEFVAVPDQTSRVLQLVTGAIDYGYDVPASARGDLPPEVESFAVGINGMYHIAINLEAVKDGPLGDPKVRQAISLAIDRQAIQDRAFFGISPAAVGFVYQGPPEGLAVLPNGGKRDLEAAKALLAQTPFKDGFKFSIQPWQQRPGWADAALIIKENLKDLNIEVLVEGKTDADAIANLNAGTYETQFTGNTQDPLTFLKNQFAEGGTWTRWGRYNNPVVSQLLIDAGYTSDPAKRIELMHEAQRLAYEDMPLIPISERVVLVASRIPRNILCEANLQPGWNPRVATVREFAAGADHCR